jgi:GntR family transcriptional regulator
VAARGGAVTALSRELGTSLHHQLSCVLRSAIVSGRYAPGDYLPGETTLTDMYGVSRATVRRALLTLESQQLVDRRAGKGTRVLGRRPAAIAMPIEEHLRLIEKGARNTTVELLRYDHGPAPREAARALRLASGAPVLRIVRVRRRGGLPLRYITNYLDPPVGDQLARADLGRITLVEALRQAGRAVHRAEDEVGATLADPATADALGLHIGDPLLEIARVMFDRDGTPLAFQWTLVPPDRFKLRLSVGGDEDRPVSPLTDYGPFAPLDPGPGATGDHGDETPA